MPEDMEADLRQAAKAAAAAAALGAAVGVVRALATRAGDDEPDEPEHEEPDHEEPQPEEPEQHVHEDDGEEPEEPEEQEEQEEQQEREPPRPAKGSGADRLRRVTDGARDLLHALSGAEIEAVSSLDRTPSGWRVTLEAVELRRIPDSTDVLATYEVELDEDGDLVRYERRRRYARSQSDHGDGR